MNWYVAKIIFQIVSDSPTAQFDEQIRLIAADTVEEAVKVADKIGETEQEDLSTVQWKYVGISHLKQLEGLKNGVEVCSNTHETDNAPHYIDFVKRRDTDMHQSTFARLKTLV